MIITKQFQILTDISLVWDFLVDIYDRKTGSGVAAPFFEYALQSSWMDQSYSFLDRLWLDGDKVVAFVFYESPVTDIFFSVRKGYEFPADELVEYAVTAMPNFNNEQRLVLFNGQEFLMEAARKRGFILTKEYEDRNYDFRNELNHPLPEGYHFVEQENVDGLKLAKLLWYGFGHGDEAPFEGWDRQDASMNWTPAKSYKGVIGPIPISRMTAGSCIRINLQKTGLSKGERKMDQAVLSWLLEEKNPEVQLRTLKEYQKLPEDDERVVDCKKRLLESKTYERALKKLRTDKPWAKYDAILAFAEWGLTRADIGQDIDNEVFALIESTGFKMLCGEPLLLRNLVKLGYGREAVVKNEIDAMLGLIKEDGGFGCISTNKKINDPRKPHKSCARLTVEYLLLAAELHLQGYRPACKDALIHYFTKRNIFYRTDDMQTPMVDVMLGTFYPPDPIKIGAHQILYALRALGCAPESEAMQAGYKVLNQHRLENGRYLLTASKSVPAFKAGNVGEENKWVTLYAYMARESSIGKDG